MPDPSLLLLIALIVLGAFVAKGATGFGESLIIIPVLLLFLDLKFVLPVVLITTAAADVYLLYYHYRDIHRPGLWLAIPGAVLGVVGGTLLLHHAGNKALRIAFAIFVLLFALRLLVWGVGQARPGGLNPAWGGLAGLAAGFIDALFGTGGPPLIIYLSTIGLSKTPFRATFVLLAFCLHLSRLFTYSASGLITRDILLTGLCLIPPMILGALLGRRLHERLDERLFQRIAAVVLVIIGLRLLY